jgi:putative Mg2+ transporter-C (MgtC) family protein
MLYFRTVNAPDLNQVSAELGRLLLAALLGGAIGFERESHGQAAGIRTNLLVCMGACLMMLLSLHMEEIFRHLTTESSVRLDPARIASYAIASMGFLGAGAILKGKGTVRGLTTAAGLWLVTGIGLAVGAGYFFPAVTSTIISLVILYGLRQLKSFFPRDIYTVLTLKMRAIERPLEKIKKIFSEYPEATIQFINSRHDIASQTTTYRLRLVNKDIHHWEEMLKSLSMIEGVEEIDWEESDVP